MSEWIDSKEVMKVLESSLEDGPLDDSWHWGRNSECKYISIRIDMRNGRCLLKNRKGEPITLDDLKYQYSLAT